MSKSNKTSNTPAGWFCWGVSAASIALGITNCLFDGKSLSEVGIVGLAWTLFLFAWLYGVARWIRENGE